MHLPNRRILIPDVAVFHPLEPSDVPDSPPLATIEILSPDDRPGDVRVKLKEYRVWGVPHVWLVDPHSRRLYSCEEELIEVESLKISDPSIEIHSADIFD